MNQTNPPDTGPQPEAARRSAVKGTKGDQAREARIKAALKANIARRKEQARARSADDEGENDD